MATMNISLPDTLKEWVEQQAASGGFSNTSDFMRDVLRKEKQRREAIAEIQGLINEAEASGYVPFEPDEFLKELLARESKDAA
jgi:antitoxin ParD1/3/4